MTVLQEVLDVRHELLEEAGCPRAILTDSSLRDSAALNKLLTSTFPIMMGSPSEACVTVQDIVHRRSVPV
jgi:hypothetical protein